MERKLPIFNLTLEALYEGSRTSNVLLPHNVTARRVKSAVAEFSDNPDDLWKVKMRPEVGYISVESFKFQFVVDFVLSLPRFLLLT